MRSRTRQFKGEHAVSVHRIDGRVIPWLGKRFVPAFILTSLWLGLGQGVFAAGSSWKLVFSQDQSGTSVPALMQVADLDRSDPDIAGLMFRCGHTALETVVIVLDPLPPRSIGTVSLTAGTQVRSFEASTIPTGAGLVVPFDPSFAVVTTWQNQRDLTLEVTAAGKTSKAVIDISGLAPALETLQKNCPAPNIGKP